MQCLASFIALTDGQASLLACLSELLDVALAGHGAASLALPFGQLWGQAAGRGRPAQAGFDRALAGRHTGVHLVSRTV